MQCSRTNSTYLDCPVANYAEKSDYTMSVAVHNPSALPMKQASFAVPHGHYKVQAFNKETQALEDVSSSVLCSEDDLGDGSKIDSCFMYIDFNTNQKDVSVIQLTYDETQNLVADEIELKESDSI